ncbi:hypothetical protein MAHJHV61_41080 [Mycobacterium avium subsp. hominissuis]|uniref:hypothetical protein n=1 Tax=Mycobacterium avium TaxID=1764 RepID=UPI000A01EEB8|nr:hypothetical protein [Mycobacterium avium]
MPNSEASGGWGRVLRYAFGVALLLVTVVATSAGVQWYLSLIGFCTALLFVLGRRRIFRPGVNRSGNEIVCRYLPWYEGNAYVLNVLVPLLGAASVGAGFAPGNPVWLRVTGIILLIPTPLFVYSAVRMWRRCILCISPSALTVRLAAPKAEFIKIPRECVPSIVPKIPNGAGSRSCQVEISYRAADSNSDHAVLLGPQLSVQPINLLNALAAWKDATDDNPSELLDRVERILRGHSTARV